jgi:hypothetical protein
MGNKEAMGRAREEWLADGLVGLGVAAELVILGGQSPSQDIGKSRPRLLCLSPPITPSFFLDMCSFGAQMHGDGTARVGEPHTRE